MPLSVPRDFDSLNPAAEEENVRLAFDVCERELGIAPLLTVEEMTSAGEPDALSMVVYLSQLYQVLRDAPPSLGETPRRKKGTKLLALRTWQSRRGKSGTAGPPSLESK